MIRILIIILALITSAHATESTDNIIQHAFRQIQSQNMWRDLTTLTSFPDRNANSKHGIAAENWIKNEVSKIMHTAKGTHSQLYMIKTAWKDRKGKITQYPQSSVMLKIGNNELPGIVIGAHFDTVGCGHADCSKHPDYRRPGADDNGSGSVILLELARILLASDTPLQSPVYLVWYAAEEDDLDGSKSVVSYFWQHHIPVRKVMQLDMTGYAKNHDTTLWLSDRHVDKNLTRTVRALAQKYIRHNVRINHLDDESDHWSWQEAGYKTVFPMESNCHGDKIKCPYREHTAQDTMDKLSLTHMTDYLKLALLFALIS